MKANEKGYVSLPIKNVHTLKSNKMTKEKDTNKKLREGNDISGSIRRSFLGAKCYYLDDNTRIKYGFSLRNLGIAYVLQRKKTIWVQKAWTYPDVHNPISLDIIKDYLLWSEEDNKVVKIECVF